MGTIADFTRQRRNLIFISATLSILYVLDARLTTLNLLGNAIDIAHPKSVYLLLWISWGYLLYRFAVYATGIGERTFVTERNQRAIQLLHRKAEGIILGNLKTSGKHNEAFASEFFELGGAVLQGLDNVGLRYVYTYGGRLRWMDGAGEWREAEIKRGVKISLLSSIHVRLHAELSDLFFTPRFSELFLPYVIAAIPLIIVLGMWTHDITF